MGVTKDIEEARAVASREGLKPIYFNGYAPDPSKHYKEIREISQKMWTLLSYSGLRRPWHDRDWLSMLKDNDRELTEWLGKITDMDVSVYAYCVLCMPIMPSSKDTPAYRYFEKPVNLLCERSYWSMLRRFRLYAGSRERADKVADFLMKFLELQVRHDKSAYVGARNVIGLDLLGRRKIMGTYHNISDRLSQLDSLGVDYEEWMEEKYAQAKKMAPESKVFINTIVNINSYEPDLGSMKDRAADEWREVRDFLGLSYECEFVDGFIPKGWNVPTEDAKDLKNIVKVRGDGFYYHKDGSQRQGKRHYASNRYFIIKCDPSNFGEFKDKWNDARLFASRPTWEEYSQWAMFPGVWDEEGNSLRHTKDVKWRKK